MNTSKGSSALAGLRRSALLATAFALAFALAPALSLRAQGESSQPAPSLPLSASFAKSSGAEDAPYVLTLKNESATAVTASAKVLLAVAFHAESKARDIGEHTIGPGETWTISDLAKGDRVTVSANGFAPLQLTVESQSMAENCPSLPLSSSFSKTTGSEDAPYVLTLKNESANPLTASAKVVLAVAFHAESKARLVSGHVMGPGETWTIPDLAKGDRVIVSADGFAPLELSVE
jgi:hypothetical protein